MLEKYFKRGAIFRWTRPAINIVPPDGILADSQKVPTPMVFQGTTGDVAVRSAMDATLAPNYFATVGLAPGAPIRYKWCDYQPGRTARIAINKTNVLTGPMSGCKIVRWTAGNTTYVGHVGTIHGMANVNTLVKGAIQPNFDAASTGFDPAAAWADQELTGNLGGPLEIGAMEVFAFVTARGKFFTTVFYTLGRSPDLKWCAGSREVPPTTGVAALALLLQ